MDTYFLPVLSHFINKNPWSGSAGRLRYRILPTVAENEGDSTLTVQVWEGPWTWELSIMEGEETFPLNEEGIAAIPAWLETWRQTMEARPRPSLEETMAWRRQHENG